MIGSYIFLGCLLAASALIAGYMFIAAKVHPGLKMLLSVVTVALALWQWNVLKTDIIGFPIHERIPDHSILITYTANTQWIFIWVVATNTGEPRAYAVPWDEKLYQKLKYATYHHHGGPISITHGIDQSDDMDQYDLKEQNNLPPKLPMEDNDQ
jgi:hypothetical protein